MKYHNKITQPYLCSKCHNIYHEDNKEKPCPLIECTGRLLNINEAIELKMSKKNIEILTTAIIATAWCTYGYWLGKNIANEKHTKQIEKTQKEILKNTIDVFENEVIKAENKQFTNWTDEEYILYIDKMTNKIAEYNAMLKD